MLLIRAIYNVTLEWMQPIIDIPRKFILDIDLEKQRLMREHYLSGRMVSSTQE